MTPPTERFTNRVDHYVLARPDYPAALPDYLSRHVGLHSAASVADIGSGGIFTRQLLERPGQVIAIEPNAAMRGAAEQNLAGHPGFRSLNGTAESTGLPDASVDLITAAQAFHWFRIAEARREFGRILRPGGQAALIWNNRRVSGFPFLEAYEDFLRTWADDYSLVNHQRFSPAVLREFFGTSGMRHAAFPHAQILDLPGMERRVLSSSSMPADGDAKHPDMLRSLAALFARHQQEGLVQIDYDSVVFHGDPRD